MLSLRKKRSKFYFSIFFDLRKKADFLFQKTFFDDRMVGVREKCRGIGAGGTLDVLLLPGSVGFIGYFDLL